MIPFQEKSALFVRRFVRGRVLLTSIASLVALTPCARAEQSYEAWRAVYDVTSDTGQEGNAVATDSRGNVFVAGFTAISGGSKIFYAAKYAALDGSLLWEKKYNSGLGDCIANAIAVDGADNVVVTGRAAGASGIADYYTVKYNGSTGAQLWEKAYAGPLGGADEASKVVVDHQDNILVTGTSLGNGSQEDFFTIKYAGANGATLWGGAAGGIRFNGTGNQKDVPAALAVDSANNLLVAGTAIVTGGKNAYTTIKYSAATGAVVWSSLITGNSEAKSVAIDKANNVLVTGFVRAANNARTGYTIKYTPGGAKVWDAFNLGNGDDFAGGPVSCAFDQNGDAFITATERDDAHSATYIATIKYLAANGALGWPQPRHSPSPNDTDTATKLVVDESGNVVITGASSRLDTGSDYYTAKYSGFDGSVLSENFYDGDANVDIPRDLALDGFGNAIVTGRSERFLNNTNSKRSRLVTIRYTRLRLATGDAVPGAGVLDSGIPAGAKIGAISTPALADKGAIAVKVGIVKGATKLNAILLQTAGGTGRIVALQGQLAAGAGGGKYLSFLDPVIAPDGRLAFTAKLSGVPPAQTNGVWISDDAGAAFRRIQTGLPLPGLDPALLPKSILSISWRNSELVALLQLAGVGVNGTNSSILYGISAGSVGSRILRTGDPLTVGGKPASVIKTISPFTPATGSLGQGRSHSAGLEAVKLTLKDKRTVLVSADFAGGAPTVLLYGDGPVPIANVNAPHWKTLGLPAVGSGNENFVAAGTLAPAASVMGSEKVLASNDAVLVFSKSGGAFNVLAREGAVAPEADGGHFTGFLEPLVNNIGDAAFIGTLAGTGITAKNKTALWWGPGASPNKLQIVARLGFPAPDASGSTATAPLFGTFVSTALSGGPDGGPLFVAKLSGPGVNAKNNLGLWALDSQGFVRRLLRTGDPVGTRTVQSFSVLNSASGALSVTRSFNAAGSVEVLVNFSDHTAGILHLAIP